MNLPNILTVIRVLLVPLLVLVYYFPYAYFNIGIASIQVGNVSLSAVNIIVLIIFCVASFTDFLDGYIARSRNLVTTFGKFLDPIADKLLVNTLFIVLTARGIVPTVPVLVMIWRDTLVDGLRLVAAQKGKVVSAGMLGKTKTVLQMFALIFILLNNLPFELYNFPMSDILLWAAMSVSVLSGIYYFVQLKDYVLESI